MNTIKFFSRLFFLCIPLLIIGCSDDDDKDDKKDPDPGIQLPVTIDFQKKSLEIDNSLEYKPLEVNGFKCWNVNREMAGSDLFYLVPNPTKENENILGLRIQDKYQEGHDIWNWTGTVLLVSASISLMVDLEPAKNISKITIIGLDNNSQFFAGVYNETTLVADASDELGSSSEEMKLVLNVGKKPVTQLYIGGYESCVKKIIIE